MSKQTNTLLGLVSGLAIGGLMGVLFAPKSGKETREDISDKAKELAEKAAQTKDELTAKLAEVSAQEQERIKEYIAQLDTYIKNAVGRSSESEVTPLNKKGKSA
jgi:gas vesicle protein